MADSISGATRNTLAMLSGRRCAIDRVDLISEGEVSVTRVIGEAAHIYGAKKGAARYKEDMTDEERHGVENLMYLCPNCHTKIDKQAEDYPAEELIRIKKEHEAWVERCLDEAMQEVSTSELDVAAKAIASGQHFVSGDFRVIPPEDKIDKNSLTAKVRPLIEMGMSRTREVERCIKASAQFDADFPDKLKNGFKERYSELRTSLQGDDLFMGMYEFATRGLHEQTKEAAGLAILAYLFHLCDVFES